MLLGTTHDDLRFDASGRYMLAQSRDGWLPTQIYRLDEPETAHELGARGEIGQAVWLSP